MARYIRKRSKNKSKNYNHGSKFNPLGSYKRRGYTPGDYNLICDRSGFKINSRDSRKEWNGRVVHKNFYEERTPLDYPPELIAERALQDGRSEPTDNFNSTVYYITDGNVYQTSKNIALREDLTLATQAQITAAIPVINDQSFTVWGGANPGDVVGTISASDPNSDTLTYTIISTSDNSTDEGPGVGTFNLNPTTGVLYVSTSLNPDVTTSYTLTVQVQDDSPGQLTDTATITITVTENTYEGLLSSFGSLTSYWPMTETSGSTFADSDSSSSSNDLTISGSPTLSSEAIASGLPGLAPDWSRTTDTATADAGTDFAGVTALTVNIWLERDSSPATEFVLEKYLSWKIGLNGSNIPEMQILRNTSGFAAQTGSSTISADTTYMITYVYDSSSTQIYVNGSADSMTEDTTNVGPTLVESGSGTLAGVSDVTISAGNIVTNGRMYHVSIHESALTADEITTMYNTGSS